MRDAVYITVYVDDFLFAGSNDKVIRYITDGLKTAFGDIKLEAGPRLSYLNVLIDTSNPQELTLSMSQYKRDIVDGIELDDDVTTPCNHHTFDQVSDCSPRLKIISCSTYRVPTSLVGQPISIQKSFCGGPPTRDVGRPSGVPVIRGERRQQCVEGEEPVPASVVDTRTNMRHDDRELLLLRHTSRVEFATGRLHGRSLGLRLAICIIVHGLFSA